jgi:hypothetical protein
MIAAHLDSLLFLLLVAVAGLFQFLAKAAGKTGRDQTQRTSTSRTTPPIPSVSGESDEDKIRKLLEALGQPPTSKPPPPVVPRTNIPPRRLAPVQPPTVYPPKPWQLTREERRKREVIPTRIPPSAAAGGDKKTAPPKITSAPAFEVHAGPSPIAPPAAIRPVAGVTKTIAQTDELRTDLATLLASMSGLRNAIILREILGPPRGLQMVDLL